MSYRWFQVHLVLPIQPVLRLKWARPAAAVLTLLLVVPVAAMAQGSPFDTGFNAIQALFHRNHCEGCKPGRHCHRRLRLRPR